MNTATAVLLFVALFLLGGVVSFVKQKMPTGLIVLLSIGVVFCLFAASVKAGVWT